MKSTLPHKTSTMYKTLLILLASAFILSSCGKSAIREKLSGADEVVISFNAQGDSTGKTVSAAEPGAVNRLIDFIDAKKADSVQVSFDGKIIFNKEGKEIQEVQFAYKDEGYRNFFYKLDGVQYYTRMSKEAADFFIALSTGKEIYW
jgi:hypothetical protein